MTALLLPALALGAGISPYLPLDLPASESRQVSLLFALADQPVMRRPVSLAAVEDAMRRACPRSPRLCEAIEAWLSRYRNQVALTSLGAEVALADDDGVSLPNRQGLRSDAPWEIDAGAHWRLSDHALISAGAIAREGEMLPSGTVLSAGYAFARLDVGFQGRWLSPLHDSAFLQSTQSANLLSASLSNELPITRARLHYEMSVSRLSWSGRIRDGDALTSGHPLLAGLHLSIQPAPGWSLGAARQLQYGGGTRDAGPLSLLKAFFAPNHYDNFRTGRPEEFGNQQAAWSSSFVYPGRKPLVVSMEFAGEDTSHGTPGRLGNAAISVGVHAPRLWRNGGLSYEFSEWQNSWYSHHVYGDGLVNRGQVLGHWGAQWRAPGDDVGGRSHALAIQWNLPGGQSLDLRLRRLANQAYSQVTYRHATEFVAGFSAPVGGMQAGAQVTTGRDVFGSRYIRVAATARLRQSREQPPDTVDGNADVAGASLFLDAGTALTRIRVTRDTQGVPALRLPAHFTPHVGVGLRRTAWGRSDLGVRLELDGDGSRTLVAIRALDYRFRVGPNLAVTAFLGAARLENPIPAYGYYAGGGLQWRDLRPRWDINLDFRYGDKLARDDVGPDGKLQGNNDTFHDVTGLALYLSRRF